MPEEKRLPRHPFAAIVFVAIFVGALSFAIGARWGIDRARAELVAKDITIRLSSVAYSRLTHSCSVAIYLGYYLKDPTNARTAKNLQGALELSTDMLDLKSFNLQEAQVSEYLRSPWLMHNYDTLADEVDEYQGAINSYQTAIQQVVQAGPDYASVSSEKRQELALALQSLQRTIESLVQLDGGDPKHWRCVPLY